MLLLKKPKKNFQFLLKKKCFTVSVGCIKWKKKMSGFFVSTLWLLVYCTDTKIICKNTIYAEQVHKHIYNRGEGNNSKKRQDKARQEEKLTN